MIEGILNPDQFDKVIKRKFSSKVTTEGGPGGRSNFGITRPTLTERMHDANFVIFVDHRKGVHVAKNRFGPNGEVSTKELIEILTRILVEHVFTGRMKVFQEGMRWRLKGAIKKIVKDGA